MHILSSIRSICPGRTHRKRTPATHPTRRTTPGLEESVEDNPSVEEKDGESGFSKAKILYTTLCLLLFFGTAYGSGFGTSAAVHHSKTNNAAGISEQLEDPAEVSLLAI